MQPHRGCFRGYGGNFFPTKADRILSRYRPIAPKPATLCISGAERSASTAVSMGNPCIKQATPSTSLASTQKCKRMRKRLSKVSEGQLRPAKRTALELQSNQLLEEPQTSNVAECVSYSGETALSSIQEDAGFMERAAASAPPSLLPLETLRSKRVDSNSYGHGGCFTELIRGIAGLPTANHVHSLLQHQNQYHQKQQQQFLSFLHVFPQQQLIKQTAKDQDDWCSNRHESQERAVPQNEFASDAVWYTCFSDVEQRNNARETAISEDAQQSCLDEEIVDAVISENKGKVTLSLLAELPMIAASPALSSGSCESSQAGGHGMSLRSAEKVYESLSEPAIRTDNAAHKLLWVNQACSIGSKEKSRMLAPLVDPLGLPAQVGQFQLQRQGNGDCTPAALRGFSTKFVADRAHHDKPSWVIKSSGAEVDNNCSASPSQQHAICARQLHCQSPSFATVITPQPVRLVGSVVSVESVCEIQHGKVSMGNLELAKKELEESSPPVLITDTSSVVRWVNTAYKAMVGQPECLWLASTVKKGGGTSSTITGEVLFSCNVEMPSAASSFSGRANVQWTRNSGERSCMTLPFDVSSFASGCSEKLLVWRFDIEASLSL